MFTTTRYIILLLIIIGIYNISFAQKKKNRKKPTYAATKKIELLRNWKLSDSFFMHYFVPNNAVTAYTNEGQKISLSQIDTFILLSIDTGTINGISGNWARDEKNINLVYYIPFDSTLTDVTGIKSKAIRKEYYGQVSERLLLLGGFILPFLFIGLYAWRAAPERVAFPWKRI